MCLQKLFGFQLVTFSNAQYVTTYGTHQNFWRGKELPGEGQYCSFVISLKFSCKWSLERLLYWAQWGLHEASPKGKAAEGEWKGGRRRKGNNSVVSSRVWEASASCALPNGPSLTSSKCISTCGEFLQTHFCAIICAGTKASY